MWAASPCSEIRTKLFQAFKKVVKISSIPKLSPLRDYTSSISSLHVLCSMLTPTTCFKSQQPVPSHCIASLPTLPEMPLQLPLPRLLHPSPLLMPADLEQPHRLFSKAGKKENISNIFEIPAKRSSAIQVPLGELQVCFSGRQERELPDKVNPYPWYF